MGVEPLSTERPRGLPQTVAHLLGAFLLSMVSNAVWVPLAAAPALIVALLSEQVHGGVLLPALFGIFIATSMGSVSGMLKNFYEASDDETEVTDILEDIQQIETALINLGVLVTIVIVYMSLLFSVTVGIATAAAPYTVFTALTLPIVDRTLLDTVNHSPVSLLVEVFAKLIVAFGIVEEIDTSILSRGGPVAFV